jgi:hypothetical protein
VIDEAPGRGIQFSLVNNLLGDGRFMAVGANHTNANATGNATPGVFVYEVPAGASLAQKWSGTRISEGIVCDKTSVSQGAPGIFQWGDVDGDGDIDIVIHGDCDPRAFVLEQRIGGTWTTHPLNDPAQAGEKLGQGGIGIADLNGDGVAEIFVSSWEANQLRLYQAIFAN